MRLGRVRPASEAAPAAEVTAINAEVGPFDFIADNRASLVTSAGLWNRIAASASQFQQPEELEHFKDGIKEVCATNSVTCTDEALDLVSREISQTLGVYSIVAARVLSAEPSALSMGLKTKKVVEFPDKNVKHIVARGTYIMRFGQRVANMAINMQEADKYSEAVLSRFIEQVGENPSLLRDMAELFEDGIGQTDPLFREFQEIIAQDWLVADPSRSHLRGLFEAARQNPEVLSGDFSHEVAKAKHDKRLLELQALARMVVAYAASTGDEISVQEALVRTYQEWQDNPAFARYASRAIDSLEETVTGMIGIHRRRSIRLPKNDNDLENLQQGMQIRLIDGEQFYSGNGNGKNHRGGSRRRSRNGNAHPATGLIEARDLQKAVESSAETEREPLNLMIAKSVNGGKNLKTVQANIEDMLGNFSIKTPEGRLESDLVDAIEFLRKKPISAASKKLGPHSKVVIDGKAASLWRLAPGRVQELGIGGENRRYRIAYTWRDGNLIIVDVLHHDAFDQKYAMG